jgi:hypothetical protein
MEHPEKNSSSAPDRLAPRTARRAGKRCQSVHNRVALDPHDVSNLLIIKPLKPIVTNKLPVHRKHPAFANTNRAMSSKGMVKRGKTF